MPDVLRAAYLRSKMVEYLCHFIGLPYIWAGDDPIRGFDCSGLIVEVLQSIGLIPHKSDFSAAALYEKFKNGAVATGYAGCLVFWLTGQTPTHVEMMIDNLHTVGASGGGSATLTKDDAIRVNAFVKMRPLNYRNQTYIIVDPTLNNEG